MRRTLLPLVVALTLTLTGGAQAGGGGGGQSFWDILNNVLNTGCNLTGQFNFGSNWEWICTLRSAYRNLRWVGENIGDYMQDLVVQFFSGALEGVMQSLGYVLGPGINNFVDQLANAAMEVRRFPNKLRQYVAKAMLEDAKAKYLPLTGRYPPNSPPDLLEQQKNTNPTVATGYAAEFMDSVKRIQKRVGAVEGVTNIAQEMKDKGSAVQEVARIAAAVNTPKDAEQKTGGAVKPGIADQLVDEAKTAASAREVMEKMVEGIAYMLRLQAASNPVLLDFLQAQLQAQLYTNGSLIGLYDEMARQAEREAGDAEYEIQAYLLAMQEAAREAELETQKISDLFTNISSMADNLPEGSSLAW
ncbi:hypothetical protein [Thermus albus]|uniref:hypothetical protein n=1 Tax=Thermus albus TaxID=2908146 RepID=UPI001FA9E4C5|nr:hypothetical protein [Thermus albus]